jgi:glycosyltransferase involved in cell wall biosynthesis
MSKNISILIPAYNEEANIEDVVKEAYAALNGTIGKHEILVLNDGSTDETGSILNRMLNEIPVLRVIEHKNNEGIGASLVDGFSSCKGDLIFFNSADKQAPMGYISKMLPYIGSYDLVVGCFIERKDSLWRIFLSRGYHFLTKVLFGVNLHNINALKLFRREIFDPGYSWGKNLCIDTELAVLAKRRGFKVCEIPLQHFPRMKGRSSVVSLKNTCSTFYNLFRLFIKINYKGEFNAGQR